VEAKDEDDEGEGGFDKDTTNEATYLLLSPGVWRVVRP